MEKTKNIIYQVIIVLLFILGIFLRTNLYLMNNVFEDDECRLAITMLDKNFWQMFLPLGDAQSAPPLFMLCSKFLADSFGYVEIILKFIPYLAGICGIFVFYKVCANYFSGKISKVLSLFIFVINYSLIFYSSTFKQYSTDVLICLICLYFMPKVLIKDLNIKQLIVLAIILIIFPFISLPSVFFIGSMIILNFIKDWKNVYKKIFLTILPVGIILLLYYVFNLAPSKSNLDLFFPNYWNDGFITLSIKGFIKILLINIKFYFYPNTFSFFTLILLIWGGVLCLFDKGKTRDISLYILIVIALVLFASLIHIYPFCTRVGLYLISIFIILVLKPLDCYTWKTFTFWLILIFTLLSFCQYNYTNIITSAKADDVVKWSPKNMMIILKENFNPETDAILVNSASAPSWLFYSSKYEFYTDKVFLMDVKNADEKIVLNYLNNLKKGQRFWLYLIKDYNQDKIFPYIFPWVKKKQILYFKQDKQSYLIYFQN